MENIIPFYLPDMLHTSILQPCCGLPGGGARSDVEYGYWIAPAFTGGADTLAQGKRMDSVFEELVAVNAERAFKFFLASLRETAVTEIYRDDEMLYVASILAHYSQTSRFDTTSMPCMANLSEVFDNFILQTSTDSEVLEFGGSQILLFAGFFRDQMHRRHNVKWYDQVGQSLYEKASQHSNNPKKRELFDRLSESFPAWTVICRNLSRTLRENRLLLKIN
jgi:hypothetical protein